MKRTGRTLSLTNDINVDDPINSISALGYRCTTIFEDDREGYAWKVVDIDAFNIPWAKFNEGWSLFTTRPDNFKSIAEFGVWVASKALFSNQMIGTLVRDLNSGDSYISLKAQHMAVNHLSLIYVDGELPTYNITLEEYEISDREEIAYKIKEISQSLNKVGEQ